MGTLSTLRAVELAGFAVEAVLKKENFPVASIDQVILGQVISAGSGQAPARQAATLAKLPVTVGAVTINKVCGSGLYAAMMADMAIRAAVYSRVVAGGMESMSQAPHLLRQGRAGWKYGSQPLVDSVDVDGLRCAHDGLPMGCYAESLANSLGITRDDQDSWAVRSHARAIAAQDSSRLDAEIVPVPVIQGRQPVIVSRDEGPRRDCTLESLARLLPAFPIESVADGAGQLAVDSGTVTAGNASTLSDGAAAVLVVDESTRGELQSDWAFRIVGHCSFAGEHRHLFTAPVHAVERLLALTGVAKSDVDLFEINEAFAAQTIACIRGLQIDEDSVNVNGGAIALGHPLGCSGARVLVSLIHNLLERGAARGIASLCLGGGEAVAMLVERD